MSNWIKVSNNNLCSPHIHFFLIRLSHTLIVRWCFLIVGVLFHPICELLLPNSIHYVNHKGHELANNLIISLLGVILW